MKVVVKTPAEGSVWDSDDGRTYFKIEIDGKKRFSFCDGEPEDANLSRDFNDCYSIPEMLRAAHAAGAAGEPFELEEVEEDD